MKVYRPIRHCGWVALLEMAADELGKRAEQSGLAVPPGALLYFSEGRGCCSTYLRSFTAHCHQDYSGCNSALAAPFWALPR